jgi:hypothetical protein
MSSNSRNLPGAGGVGMVLGAAFAAALLGLAPAARAGRRLGIDRRIDDRPAARDHCGWMRGETERDLRRFVRWRVDALSSVDPPRVAHVGAHRGTSTRTRS